jgi:hypothetical protein
LVKVITMQLLRRSLGAALLTCVCSCSPSIYTFKAEPNRVCSGDAVTLSWNASKGGLISGPQAPGAVDAQGSAQVSPRGGTVRYHFEVRNLFGSAARDVDVEVADGKLGPIGQSIADPSATCSGSTLGVTAVAPPELVSSHLLVGTISTLAEDRHAYHVEHAGKSADLTPGSSTDAFKGLSLSGEWRLSLTLLAGEQCGTPSVPRNLGVQVVTSCTPGG